MDIRTATQLYALEPQEVSTDLDLLLRNLDGVFPFYVNPFCVHQSEEAPRIRIHWYKEFWFDYRRVWALGGVYFDDQPVMVIRCAGREGDDHRSRFVTDLPRFKVMMMYLCGLAIQYELSDPSWAEELPVVDPDSEVDKLTEFYSNCLGGIFEKARY